MYYNIFINVRCGFLEISRNEICILRHKTFILQKHYVHITTSSAFFLLLGDDVGSELDQVEEKRLHVRTPAR